MENGLRRRRRRKNARRRAALGPKIDALPDDILELVFLRLPLPVHLVRAACTCKCWRRIIAADDGRLIRSLHGTPSSHLIGSYSFHHLWYGSRPPGREPVFVRYSFIPSPWADILARRSLALDFLPRTEFGFCWELADIRDGLLLISEMSDDVSLASPLRLLVCDPLARRYKRIRLPAWFHGWSCLGAFLLDGEWISLSNFRVTCALNRDCVARACVFSYGGGGGRWTSGHDSPVANGADIRFMGFAEDGSIAYWTMGGAPIILSLDKEAAEFSSSSVPDKEKYAALRDKRTALMYVYCLSWPPTIRACLS